MGNKKGRNYSQWLKEMRSHVRGKRKKGKIPEPSKEYMVLLQRIQNPSTIPEGSIVFQSNIAPSNEEPKEKNGQSLPKEEIKCRVGMRIEEQDRRYWELFSSEAPLTRDWSDYGKRNFDRIQRTVGLQSGKERK